MTGEFSKTVCAESLTGEMVQTDKLRLAVTDEGGADEMCYLSICVTVLPDMYMCELEAQVWHDMCDMTSGDYVSYQWHDGNCILSLILTLSLFAIKSEICSFLYL